MINDTEWESGQQTSGGWGYDNEDAPKQEVARSGEDINQNSMGSSSGWDEPTQPEPASLIAKGADEEMPRRSFSASAAIGLHPDRLRMIGNGGPSMGTVDQPRSTEIDRRVTTSFHTGFGDRSFRRSTPPPPATNPFTLAGGNIWTVSLASIIIIDFKS